MWNYFAFSLSMEGIGRRATSDFGLRSFLDEPFGVWCMADMFVARLDSETPRSVGSSCKVLIPNARELWCMLPPAESSKSIADPYSMDWLAPNGPTFLDDSMCAIDKLALRTGALPLCTSVGGSPIGKGRDRVSIASTRPGPVRLALEAMSSFAASSSPAPLWSPGRGPRLVVATS